MQNLRRASQGIFLLIFLFLFLQTESKGADRLGYPVKIFLDFDPLIFITTILSAHTVVKALCFSLIVLIATAILGRVFCGWVCPLGTLNHLIGSLKKRRFDAINRDWYAVKYSILIFLIASSLFTLQLVGIMDPISLLIRSVSISVYPLFNYTIRSVFDTIYNLHPAGIVDISESIYDLLKRSILSFNQPFFNQGAFIGLIFFFILGLNLVESRFWCRYLCPLGALLGILSRYSLLKRSVSEGCNECESCASSCQGNASPDQRGRWKSAECLYCWNCDDVCPQNAVRFGFFKKGESAAMDIGRRKVLTSLLTGALAVPLLRTAPLSRSNIFSSTLIRPPGALDEEGFLKRCVKCGECMKVCITNGLQPTFLEAGIEGIWSPVLVPAIGYCEFRCTLCGQVCPTGAIKALEIREKMEVKIGLATIDKSRCLPYSHSIPCIVCEEVCPTPKKAIWFESVKTKDRLGKETIIQQPRVDLELCIGCGICETNCPVKSRPAIYVTSVGESRSLQNRILLS